MNLQFKKPNPKTQLAMSKLAKGEINEDYHKIAEEKILKFTRHNFSKLVNSGNAAILASMNAIDGAVLIPDQGAWNGFKQIANFLNKPLITVKTNHGLIDLELLQNSINENKDLIDFNDENKKSALFLTSFTAYTAEQDIKSISNLLHENNILLVEDASGAICDSSLKLANGSYSDIIIGSTGSPKIINVCDGGFISTDDNSIFDKSRLLLKTSKTSNITSCGIATEIEFAQTNLDKTINACNYLKKELSDDFHIFHKDRRGINVILQSDNPKQLSYKLRQEFTLDEHGMITKCPNYNRLKEKAVAIEIKNIDYPYLEKNYLDEIISILLKYK